MRAVLLLSVSLPLLLGGCKLSPFAFGYTIGPDGVTIYDCNVSAAGKLVIPDTIKGKPVIGIGPHTFLGCRSLTSITIPDSVTSIEGNAFSGCTSLTTIEVSAGNWNYTGFNGVLFNKERTTLHAYPAGKTRASYTIPDSVTSIGWGAFFGCRSLTSITIPDSVTSLGSHAFFGCTRLTRITIGDSVTRIGDYAFGKCTSLTSITIPDSVTSIEEKAFWNCTKLSAVTFLGDAPKVAENAFEKASPTIYRNPEAKGWGETWGGRPVKLISEKP